MCSLYLHIPFCKSRCIYCAFYSTTLADELQDKYTDALIGEMQLREKDDVGTIYLGGGTPSLLSEHNLKRLFHNIYSYYNVKDGAEVTIECNPDDITPAFEETIRQIPVNRVSLGAQTFDDERLQFLHRRHSSKQVFHAVELLRNVGISNISLDLMFGFPNETLPDLEKDIDTLLSLKPEHISAYSLMYEAGTVLYEQLIMENEKLKMKDEKLGMRDDELSREMYEMIMDKLEAAGYEHYEISNWCRKTNDGTSLRSRHNSSYWHDVPYIGLGAAAHSYDLKTRSWNVSDLRTYIYNINNGVRPFDFESIDDTTHYNDTITTALRTREGISLETLKEPYKTYLLKNAERHISEGLMRLYDCHLSLTRKGLFISDSIMSDLIFV